MRPSSADTSEPACTKRKMLSMKRRTSWPWSRKYSAIVRPERPTRRRAPGGSFIWPKTSATLSMTPDSSISRRRSFPSRERSPTPAKTETPPCCIATLWMSSWMSTVLPRPAPPKKPTFPPLTNGAMRSMTLSPVSKISSFGERSRKAGGSRWIGQRSTSLRRRLLLVDRIAGDVPEPPERRVADGDRDRAVRVGHDRAARRCRRSSPSRRPGRDRRRGAAAPPRSASRTRRPAA